MGQIGGVVIWLIDEGTFFFFANNVRLKVFTGNSGLCSESEPTFLFCGRPFNRTRLQRINRNLHLVGWCQVGQKGVNPLKIAGN